MWADCGRGLRIQRKSAAQNLCQRGPVVDRVVGSVRHLELPPPRRAPGAVVFGDAPMEYDLNRFPRRNLRRDLRRNRNLAVRHDFASEVDGLQFSSLTPYIISRVPAMG